MYSVSSYNSSSNNNLLQNTGTADSNAAFIQGVADEFKREYKMLRALQRAPSNPSGPRNNALLHHASKKGIRKRRSIKENSLPAAVKNPADTREKCLDNLVKGGGCTEVSNAYENLKNMLGQLSIEPDYYKKNDDFLEKNIMHQLVQCIINWGKTLETVPSQFWTDPTYELNMRIYEALKPVLVKIEKTEKIDTPLTIENLKNFFNARKNGTCTRLIDEKTNNKEECDRTLSKWIKNSENIERELTPKFNECAVYDYQHKVYISTLYNITHTYDTLKEMVNELSQAEQCCKREKGSMHTKLENEIKSLLDCMLPQVRFTRSSRIIAKELMTLDLEGWHNPKYQKAMQVCQELEPLLVMDEEGELDHLHTIENLKKMETNKQETQKREIKKRTILKWVGGFSAGFAALGSLLGFGVLIKHYRGRPQLTHTPVAREKFPETV